MSKQFSSYRELVADALSPKPVDAHSGVLVLKNLQFQPSRAALDKADALRKKLRAERLELKAANDR